MKSNELSISEKSKARFWAKVERAGDNECWIWKGWFGASGYGAFWDTEAKRSVVATRWMIWITTGEAVPEELFVCHRCDNRKCVNPNHLFVGTQTDNMRDCSAKGRIHCPPKMTHCKSGHEFTAENTYFYTRSGRKSPQRQCRACMRDKDRRLRAAGRKP